MNDALVRELRRVLDDVDGALAAEPTTMPPWEHIRSFIQRSRVRRRRRISALVAGAAAVVAVLILAQNTVLQPVLRGEPAGYGDEVRGSLAGDEEWLAQLREWAATHNPSQRTDSGAFERSKERARNIEVVYASDVGDYRVAVIRGDWKGVDGVTVDPAVASVQVWGRRGAAPEELSPVPPPQSGLFGRELDAKSWMQVISPNTWHAELSNRALAGLGGSAYLVTGTDREVILQEPPTIAADGTVTQHSRRIKGENGVYEVALTGFGHYALVVPGQAYQDFFLEPVAVSRPLIATPADRGGRSPSEQALAGIAEDSWLTSRQTFSESAWIPLAAETGAVDEQNPHRAVAGTLQLMGGARVLAAGHLSAADGKLHSELDIAQLLPAGDFDTMSIAWQVTTGLTDKSAPPGVTGVAALGPAGTVTVEWTGPEGTTTSPAVDTLARTDRQDVRSVRFLDATGGELGTEPVREGEVPVFDGSYPGKPHKVVEQRPIWLLPEIREGLAGY